MIRIAMADDHPLVIKGLRDMLRAFEHIEILFDCMSGAELLDRLTIMQPDVLLLDIQMKGLQGDEVAQLVNEKYPRISILALTNLDQSFHVKNMLRSGALGYLLKSTSDEQLVKAIETVNLGKQYIDPLMKEVMVDEMYLSKTELEKPPVLGHREKEVLQLIADEYTSHEIADKLIISIRTVENHRVNLLTKFNSKNVAGMVKKAVMMGLIE